MTIKHKRISKKGLSYEDFLMKLPNIVEKIPNMKFYLGLKNTKKSYLISYEC